MAPATVSVVLPTFNEAETICALVAELRATLDRHWPAYEILVVDDASPDGTADRIAAAYGDGEAVRLVRRAPPHGLAVSIRDGIARARGEIVVVMDADFNHDPADVPRLLDALPSADLVGGSRFLPGGGMYSRTRQLGSGAMNVVIRAVVRTGIRDNLSGFFAVRRATLTALPLDAIFFGYGDYYFRLLWHARRHGLRVREIAVAYPPRRGGESKTPLVRTAFKYTAAALRFVLTRRAMATLTLSQRRGSD